MEMSCVFNYLVSLPNGSERSGIVMVDGLKTVEEALQCEYVQEQITSGVGNKEYKILSLTMPSCEGCRENQPNQQAHMDYGGCLYDTEE